MTSLKERIARALALGADWPLRPVKPQPRQDGGLWVWNPRGCEIHKWIHEWRGFYNKLFRTIGPYHAGDIVHVRSRTVDDTRRLRVMSCDLVFLPDVSSLTAQALRPWRSGDPFFRSNRDSLEVYRVWWEREYPKYPWDSSWSWLTKWKDETREGRNT